MCVLHCGVCLEVYTFFIVFKVIINSAWALCLLIDDDQVINNHSRN